MGNFDDPDLTQTVGVPRKSDKQLNSAFCLTVDVKYARRKKGIFNIVIIIISRRLRGHSMEPNYRLVRSSSAQVAAAANCLCPPFSRLPCQSATHAHTRTH